MNYPDIRDADRRAEQVRGNDELTRYSIEPDIDRYFGEYRLQARSVEFKGILPLFVT